MALYALCIGRYLMGALVFPHTVCRHFIHQSPSIVQCRVYFTLLLTPLAYFLPAALSLVLISTQTHIQSTNKSGILVLIALNSNNNNSNSNHILYYGEKWKNNTYRIIIIILFFFLLPKTTFVVVVWSNLSPIP